LGHEHLKEVEISEHGAQDTGMIATEQTPLEITTGKIYFSCERIK